LLSTGLSSIGISPLEKITFQNKEIYIKRDDLLHPFFNGNKARKLHYLIKTRNFEFDHLISWGGSQSNAMYALSSLANLKKWEFTYFTHQIDPVIKNNPSGNLKNALENGMKLLELKTREYVEIINFLPQQFSDQKSHIVPMGAQSKLAEEGIKLLAAELKEQIYQLKLKEQNTDIFLSSGTGTTAAFLAKHMPDFQVYTVACVGKLNYLKEQIKQICFVPENLIMLESILNIPFARPHKELFQIYKELKNAGIEFDLIYDTQVWLWIKNYFDKIKNRDIIFIHSGGVHGNESQLKRYHRNGIV